MLQYLHMCAPVINNEQSVTSQRCRSGVLEFTIRQFVGALCGSTTLRNSYFMLYARTMRFTALQST